MHILKFSIVVCLVVGILSVKCQTQFDISESITRFTCDLHHTLDVSFEDGFVVSPISIYIAASLLSMGASGNTSDDIWKSLAIDATDRAQFAGAMSQFLQSFVDTPTLMLDTKLFINETDVQADFVQLATSNFECDMLAVDYSDPLKSIYLISEWVLHTTDNYSINTAYSGTYFPNDIFLASILSFNAEWEQQFDAENTTVGTFHTAGGQVSVDMMYLEGNLTYFVLNGFEAVVLDYKNSNWSFVLILSDEALSEHLRTVFIRNITSNMRNLNKVFVKLTMPKFNVTFNHELAEILTQMGAGSMFQDDADFSAMLNDQNRLTDSQYLIKFSIDEWGTGQSTNGSADSFQRTPYPNGDIIEVIVDHSFTYFVLDQWSELVLLDGYMKSPAISE